MITGWPVGGIAAGCAAFFLPAFFTVGRQMERRIERLEALEEWVRRLADSMAVGSAPVATIVRSAARAPEAIRPEVSELAQRLGTARWDRSVALRQFADRIDDSLGDVIALALEIAVSARASERVPGVLRQMADAAAEEVKARRQIEVERAAPRNEARILVLFNVAVMVVVAVFTDYTAPYATPLGQAFLAILMLVLTGCIWLLRKYSLGEATPRILVGCRHRQRPDREDGGDPVMSSLWMVALVAGAAVGLGVGVLVYLVAVPQRPALAPLMKLAGSRPQPALSIDVVLPQRRGGARGRLLATATQWVDVDWLTSPDADLAMIEKSRQQFLLERVGLTLIGLCIVPIWGVMMWALGVELPVVIPLVGSIALAVGFWFLAINRVRVAAAERRREMRYALVSYLTLVALHRAAGEGRRGVTGVGGQGIGFVGVPADRPAGLCGPAGSENRVASVAGLGP